MFGLQPWHLIAILGIALIVFGPSRLPEIGKTLAKTVNEFRDATTQTRDEMKKVLDEKPAVDKVRAENHDA